MWLSLVGFVLCVAVMFLISWTTALLTFAAILFLYMVVVYRKPGKKSLEVWMFLYFIDRQVIAFHGLMHSY